MPGLNKILMLTAAVILAAILFAFLHSEVGLFGYDGYDHGDHDYCEILKTAVTKITKDGTANIKQKIEKAFSFDCVKETNQRILIDAKNNFAQNHILPKTTEIYLFKKAFLI